MKSTFLLPICVAAAAAVVAVSAPAHAAVILTGNSSIPGSSEVNTGTTSDSETDFRPGRIQTQTFTVGTAFTLDAFYIAYEAPGGGYVDGTFDLRIFTVANVNATTVTPGTSLLTIPITLDAAARSAAFFTTSSTVTSILKFDLTGADEISLAATTGTAGYGVQLFSTGTASAGGFFTTKFLTAGTYANGRFNGSANDANLVLTAVPEPSSLLLVLMGATGLVSRRRR